MEFASYVAALGQAVDAGWASCNHSRAAFARVATDALERKLKRLGQHSEEE